MFTPTMFTRRRYYRATSQNQRLPRKPAPSWAWANMPAAQTSEVHK
eukprot:CAMPEP_0116941222 /NCGR_PEP_ID=MMETSP0467-20121206/33854_1 /TAXON_ID=283647 /ORGANISM="Mesodinium pulex, Strain SPMC105" /LENGTH=45 /DNA_ID= /DNA_START= /DNA_END= /DNA_ORIENTATION=